MPTIFSYTGTGTSLSLVSIQSEGVTYTYNQSAYISLISLDYGYIFNGEDLYEDYGSITNYATEVESFGKVTSSNTIPTYGLVSNIRSNTVTTFNLGVIGGIEFVLQGGAFASFGTPYIGYDLVSVSGGTQEEKAIFNYIGSGSLFEIVELEQERITYNYNQSSRVSLTSDDYGVVTELENTSEDYGSISSPITSGNLEDYNLIRINKSELPYGIFGINSSANTIFNIGNIGSGSIFTFSSTTESTAFTKDASGLFKIVGTVKESFGEGLYTGSGTLFTIAKLEQERITYNYNQASAIYLDVDDYGVTSNTHEVSEDYGLLAGTVYLPLQRDNYGFIVDNDTRTPYGIFGINSSANTIFNIGNIGSGSIFTFSSTTESISTSVPKTTELFRITGSLVEKSTADEVGSGSLFGFSGAAESVSLAKEASGIFKITGSLVEKSTADEVGSGSIFSFSSTTESSTNVKLETTELFKITGAATDIRSTGSEVGSGSLFGFSGAAEAVSLAKEASGIFKITGSLVEKSTADEVGSGSIFTFSSTTESSTNVKPETTELFRITGAATDIRSTGSEVGSGSLFGFSGAAERVAFSYNQSSAVTSLTEFLDYGFINNLENSTDVYGFIIEHTFSASQKEDYGFLVSNVVTKLPYGKLKITSEPIEKSIANYVGSGSIFSFSSTTESSTNVKLETTELFRISGSLVEKSTADEVGSGSLFSFSGAAEAVSLAKEASGIFKITGSLVEKSTADEVGSGSIFTFSSTTESSTNVKPETTELFRITGAATDIRSTGSEVGSGSLFGFSGAAERVAFSYNQSSAVTRSDDDYRLITNTYDISEDYRLLTGTVYLSSQKDNYGFIVDNDTRIPYGKLKITSEPIEKSIANYVGSGSLFGFSGAAEAVSLAKEASGIFKITGSLVEKSTADEVGSGSLFGFSGAAERVTFSYNESSVVTSLTEFLDYGFINNVHTSEDNYGSIIENTFSASQKEDYGFLVSNVVTKLPYGSINLSGTFNIKKTDRYVGSGSIFTIVRSDIIFTFFKTGSGTINISGTVTESFGEGLYSGSGSIFAFSSTTESSTNVKPKTAELFRITGSLVEKSTADEVGSGSIFTFSSTTESSTNVKLETTELFKITGSLVEKSTADEVGSGSLFGFSGAAEAVSLAKEASGIFKITGSLVEKSTADEVGSGSIFTFSSTTESSTNVKLETTELFRISGSLVEKSTADEVGSGSLFGFSGAAESVSTAVPKTAELFRITGSLVEKSTADEVGSGSIFISGRSLTTPSSKQTGGGTITIFDSSAESISPTTYIASGSTFTFLNKIILDSTGKQRYASVEESTTNIPPVFGTGMSLSGRVLIFFQYIETGSGTLSIRGNAIAQPSAKHISSGKFQISGSANESIVPAPHISSGSIFTFISSTESTSSVIPETTELFKITGAATDIKITHAHNGQCELILTGEANIVIKPIHLGLGRIRVNGVGKESTVPAPHISSGSIFTFISSTESTSSVIPETTELFKITGAATDIKITKSEIGLGSLFAFVSATKITVFAKEASGIFKFSGIGNESFTKGLYTGKGIISEFSYKSIIDSTGKVTFISLSESASFVPRIEAGVLNVNSNGLESKSIPYIGSGSLLGFVSKTESTSSVEESKVLFKFSGIGNESFTKGLYTGKGIISEFSYKSIDESASFVPRIEAGVLNVNSNGLESKSIPYIGSGSIFTIVSFTESTSSVEESKVLFKFSGIGNESFTKGLYTGKGIISEFSYKSIDESASFVPRIEAGVLNVNSNGLESKSIPYIGSGSLLGFVSKTESTSSVEESKVLFRISGTSIERFNNSYEGSGTVFAFVGSAESSTTNIPKTVELFKISGSAEESITPRGVIGNASAQINAFSTENSTISEISFVQSNIFGELVERSLFAHTGSGILRNLNSAAIVSANIYRLTTILLTIFGSAGESFSRPTYNGSGTTFISVNSRDIKVDFDPPKPSQIQII